MKSIIISLIMIIGAPWCHAGVLIREGDTYYWNFTLQPGGGTTAGAIYQGYDKLDSGERVRFSFYDDAATEPPLYSLALNGTTSGMSGIFWLNFSQRSYFQDRDGIFSISMITGSIYLTSLYICTNIEGSNYYASIQPTEIPESNSLSLLTGAIVLGCTFFRRKRARDFSCEVQHRHNEK